MIDLTNSDSIKSIIPTVLPFLAVIFTALGVLIGYFVKAFLDKKERINSQLYEKKREAYRTFIGLVIDLFSGKETTTIVASFREFYKDCLFFASPKIITLYGDFFQYLYLNPKVDKPFEQMKLITKIIGEMRIEIGLSNKNLGKNSEILLRPIITDFDSQIATPKKRKFFGIKY
jgi:hypothetical protein